MNGNARREDGFTLIELLVVMSIAALLFVLIAPSGPRQRDRAEMANSARAIAAALRMARSRAIASDRPAIFAVDVEAGRFTGAAAGTIGELPRGASVMLTTTQDETSSASRGAIRFYPDGSSTGGGLTILRSADRYDVLVDWLTGAVSIHEQHGPALLSSTR
jgi:general secretion pathway protein H